MLLELEIRIIGHGFTSTKFLHSTLRNGQPPNMSMNVLYRQ